MTVDGSLVFLKKFNETSYKVLFVKRSDQTSSFKSAHVFPGGMVEAIADDTQSWTHIFPPSSSSSSSSTSSSSLLFSQSQSVNETSFFKFKIASIREAFEETGLLYCKPGILDPEQTQRLREKVHENPLLFADICGKLAQTPRVNELIHFSHWLTPTRYAKRFETHFFIAILEPHLSNLAISDLIETVETVWMSPSEALKEYELGNIVLFPPQWYMIQEMVKHANLEDFLSYAKQKRNVPMLPEFIKDGRGKPISVLPGDDKHSTFNNTGPLFAPFTKHRLSYDLDEKGNILKIQFCPESYQLTPNNIANL